MVGPLHGHWLNSWTPIHFIFSPSLLFTTWSPGLIVANKLQWNEVVGHWLNVIISLFIFLLWNGQLNPSGWCPPFRPGSLLPSHSHSPSSDKMVTYRCKHYSIIVSICYKTHPQQVVMEWIGMGGGDKKWNTPRSVISWIGEPWFIFFSSPHPPFCWEMVISKHLMKSIDILFHNTLLERSDVHLVNRDIGWPLPGTNKDLRRLRRSMVLTCR